jgi:hypothetical protein
MRPPWLVDGGGASGGAPLEYQNDLGSRCDQRWQLGFPKETPAGLRDIANIGAHFFRSSQRRGPVRVRTRRITASFSKLYPPDGEGKRSGGVG